MHVKDCVLSREYDGILLVLVVLQLQKIIDICMYIFLGIFTLEMFIKVECVMFVLKCNNDIFTLNTKRYIYIASDKTTVT